MKLNLSYKNIHIGAIATFLLVFPRKSKIEKSKFQFSEKQENGIEIDDSAA